MDATVESIERATLAAVPPQAVSELSGWLLGLDDGTVGRAHSCVPLRHDPAPPLPLEKVQAAYADRRLQPVFRLPALAAFDEAANRLSLAGFAPRQPTLCLTAELHRLVQAHLTPVQLAPEPDQAWARLFLGTGSTEADAISRLAILRRARGSMFASVRVEGEIAAVGVCCVAYGWCGIHGMRTSAAWRGRGLASAILAAFGRHALAAGATHAFLQVEQANEVARSVYRRAGFNTAWPYAYWRGQEG